MCAPPTLFLLEAPRRPLPRTPLTTLSLSGMPSRGFSSAPWDPPRPSVSSSTCLPWNKDRGRMAHSVLVPPPSTPTTTRGEPWALHSSRNSASEDELAMVSWDTPGCLPPHKFPADRRRPFQPILSIGSTLAMRSMLFPEEALYRRTPARHCSSSTGVGTATLFKGKQAAPAQGGARGFLEQSTRPMGQPGISQAFVTLPDSSSRGGCLGARLYSVWVALLPSPPSCPARELSHGR